MAMFAVAGVIIAISLGGRKPGPRSYVAASVAAALAGAWLYAAA